MDDLTILLEKGRYLQENRAKSLDQSSSPYNSARTGILEKKINVAASTFQGYIKARDQKLLFQQSQQQPRKTSLLSSLYHEQCSNGTHQGGNGQTEKSNGFLETRWTSTLQVENYQIKSHNNMTKGKVKLKLDMPQYQLFQSLERQEKVRRPLNPRNEMRLASNKQLAKLEERIKALQMDSSPRQNWDEDRKSKVTYYGNKGNKMDEIVDKDKQKGNVWDSKLEGVNHNSREQLDGVRSPEGESFRDSGSSHSLLSLTSIKQRSQSMLNMQNNVYNSQLQKIKQVRGKESEQGYLKVVDADKVKEHLIGGDIVKETEHEETESAEVPQYSPQISNNLLRYKNSISENNNYNNNNLQKPKLLLNSVNQMKNKSISYNSSNNNISSGSKLNSSQLDHRHRSSQTLHMIEKEIKNGWCGQINSAISLDNPQQNKYQKEQQQYLFQNQYMPQIKVLRSGNDLDGYSRQDNKTNDRSKSGYQQYDNSIKMNPEIIQVSSNSSYLPSGSFSQQQFYQHTVIKRTPKNYKDNTNNNSFGSFKSFSTIQQTHNHNNNTPTTVNASSSINPNNSNTSTQVLSQKQQLLQQILLQQQTSTKSFTRPNTFKGLPQMNLSTQSGSSNHLSLNNQFKETQHPGEFFLTRSSLQHTFKKDQQSKEKTSKSPINRIKQNQQIKSFTHLQNEAQLDQNSNNILQQIISSDIGTSNNSQTNLHNKSNISPIKSSQKQQELIKQPRQLKEKLSSSSIESPKSKNNVSINVNLSPNVQSKVECEGNSNSSNNQALGMTLLGQNTKNNSNSRISPSRNKLSKIKLFSQTSLNIGYQHQQPLFSPGIPSQQYSLQSLPQLGLSISLNATPRMMENTKNLDDKEDKNIMGHMNIKKTVSQNENYFFQKIDEKINSEVSEVKMIEQDNEIGGREEGIHQNNLSNTSNKLDIQQIIDEICKGLDKYIENDKQAQREVKVRQLSNKAFCFFVCRMLHQLAESQDLEKNMHITDPVMSKSLHKKLTHHNVLLKISSDLFERLQFIIKTKCQDMALDIQSQKLVEELLIKGKNVLLTNNVLEEVGGRDMIKKFIGILSKELVESGQKLQRINTTQDNNVMINEDQKEVKKERIGGNKRIVLEYDQPDISSSLISESTIESATDIFSRLLHGDEDITVKRLCERLIEEKRLTITAIEFFLMKNASFALLLREFGKHVSLRVLEKIETLRRFLLPFDDDNSLGNIELKVSSLEFELRKHFKSIQQYMQPGFSSQSLFESIMNNLSGQYDLEKMARQAKTLLKSTKDLREIVEYFLRLLSSQLYSTNFSESQLINIEIRALKVTIILGDEEEYLGLFEDITELQVSLREQVDLAFQSVNQTVQIRDFSKSVDIGFLCFVIELTFNQYATFHADDVLIAKQFYSLTDQIIRLQLSSLGLLLQSKKPTMQSKIDLFLYFLTRILRIQGKQEKV